MLAIRIQRSSINDLLIGLSIFVSSITFFKEPFEGYFHYIIFLLYFPFFITRYGWKVMPLKLMLIPLVFTIINVVNGNCEMFGFFKIFAGMLLSITFYQYVFEHYEYNYEKLFKIYCKGIMICCYIALIQLISYNIGFKQGYNYSWILNKWGFHVGGFLGLRLNSIFSEPSQFALVLLPAVFVTVYSFLKKDFRFFSFKECVIILACLVLATSSTGYIGVFVALLIIGINFGQILNLLLIATLGIFGYLALYTWVPDFKARVDHSMNLLTKDKYSIDDINSSSFVLFNNSHITFSNLADHPLTGTGLGSYPIAYERYSLTRAEDFLIKKGFDNNAQDGNSLFFRSVAELGILGLIFWFVFVFRFFKRKTPEDDFSWIVSGAMLTIIFGYLLRQGNYFINGFPFFCLFYYYLKVYPVEKTVVTEQPEEVPEVAV